MCTLKQEGSESRRIQHSKIFSLVMLMHSSQNIVLRKFRGKIKLFTCGIVDICSILEHLGGFKQVSSDP